MDMSPILQLALDRKRCKCEHETVYTNEHMQQWLLEALPPNWSVYLPSVLGETALAAAWPADGSERDEAKAFLNRSGCTNPDDLLDGHCEAMAIALSREHKALLDAGKEDPASIPDLAHKTALASLQTDECAAERVFGAFSKGFVDGHATWTSGVWGDRFSGTEGAARLCGFLYGGSGVQESIRAFAAELTAAPAGEHVAWMPMYILNYIWDGDELTKAQMAKEDAEETAQYSCHVVGLVIDASRRVLCVADPNGGLLPGGNMEFLAVPPTLRAATSSTKMSRFDLDERAKKRAKKATSTGGGKKRERR